MRADVLHTNVLKNACINSKMQQNQNQTRLHLLLWLAGKQEHGDTTGIFVHLRVDNGAASKCDSLVS